MEPPELDGYNFVRRLGSGGFAEVYLYDGHRPARQVAIKVLRETDEATQRRFTAEADAMAALSNHPHIVSIYHADVTQDGHAYLVMEFCPHENYNVRARSERFSVDEAVRVGIQIASAVETAHQAGFLHRDIKPANILTTQYFQPALTDFGIASRLEGTSDESEGLSIPWSPPEVIRGDAAVDVRSDVYSLGATVYTLLAGRSPFERTGGDNKHVVLMDRIEREAAPAIGRPDIPDALERLISQSLAKDPAARPQTAREFGMLLQEIELSGGYSRTDFQVPSAPRLLAGVQIDPSEGETRFRPPITVDAQGDGHTAVSSELTRVPRQRKLEEPPGGPGGLINAVPGAGQSGGPVPSRGQTTEEILKPVIDPATAPQKSAPVVPRSPLAHEANAPKLGDAHRYGANAAPQVVPGLVPSVPVYRRRWAQLLGVGVAAALVWGVVSFLGGSRSSDFTVNGFCAETTAKDKYVITWTEAPDGGDYKYSVVSSSGAFPPVTLIGQTQYSAGPATSPLQGSSVTVTRLPDKKTSTVPFGTGCSAGP